MSITLLTQAAHYQYVNAIMGIVFGVILLIGTLLCTWYVFKHDWEDRVFAIGSTMCIAGVLLLSAIMLICSNIPVVIDPMGYVITIIGRRS